MPETATTRAGRKRARTWSSFGNLGRKPTEYEVVTHNMNHTFGGSGEPLEMAPTVHGNVWLRQHRDAHLFGITEWNAFRDPDEITYRKYCHLQDDQETYVDGLLNEFTAIKSADGMLGSNALDFLQLAMAPCRYLGHGEQMLSAYIQQLSPSTYISNCAVFQTADALRRVQRVAYRTKQLANAHPLRGFGSNERATWETDSDWQPTRRAIELLLVEYDFDHAFVGFQLCIKPIVDNLFLQQFAIVAQSLGAEVDALIANSLYLDSQRSRRWTAAMVQFLFARNPDIGRTIQNEVAAQRVTAEEVIVAAARLLARHATWVTAQAFGISQDRKVVPTVLHDAVAHAIELRVRSDWAAFLGECGGIGDG